MDREVRAKEILSTIRYVTLATASPDAEPWSTPVLFACDEQFNFYWTSMADAHHSRNIQANPRVYLTCFDSTVLPREGGAVYAMGSAKELTDAAEIDQAAALLYARKNKPARKADEFLGASPKRMYKMTPEKFWINLDVDVKNDPQNPKKEISLI